MKEQRVWETLGGFMLQLQNSNDVKILRRNSVRDPLQVGITIDRDVMSQVEVISAVLLE
jgi:hypothetical protein